MPTVVKQTIHSKLSNKEQRELASLPVKIEQLEQRQSKLEREMSAPDFYQSDQQKVQRATEEFARIQEQLKKAFDRWDELEEVRGSD